MNPPKPQKSLAGQTCPLCRSGKFHLVQIDHTENVAEAEPIEIKGIWVDRCENCGEIVFPADTTAYIESVVAEQTEQLTSRELERIREDLGVATQDEMSVALGLGRKSYHKWESGAQFPTRSMSFYIRVLAEFPEAFVWLQNREWRKSNRLANPASSEDLGAMFPDLARRSSPSLFPWPPGDLRARRNPALGLTRATFIGK